MNNPEQSYKQAFTVCGTLKDFVDVLIKNMDCPDTLHNRKHLEYALMHQRQIGAEDRTKMNEAMNRGL